MGSVVSPEGVRRRKNGRFEQRRGEIVDTCAELFAAKGFASTGISEIGEAVGLARGALYHYIGSKEELLVEIHDRVMDPLLGQCQVIERLALDAPTRLRLVSETLLGQIILRPNHCWVFLHEYRSLTGKHRDDFRQKRAVFENIVRGVLSDGAKAGVLQVDDVDTSMLAFLGMHNYTYQWAHTRHLEVAGLSRLYCDIFLRGVATAAVAEESRISLESSRESLKSLLVAPTEIPSRPRAGTRPR